MVTQVISTVNDPYSDQVVIDKGSVNGVYEGQPVISDKGVVGQVVAVAKLTSRVLLICDATHALPIQVLRNDIRVIAAVTVVRMICSLSICQRIRIFVLVMCW